jgi:iron complex outermembrane receptor protein
MMKSSPRFARTLCASAVAAAFTLTLPSIAFAQTAAASQAAEPAPAAADAGAAIPSVMVTSRKFTERLVDVPIAISVFTNADLLKRGSANIADVLQTVPGVSVYETFAGSSAISIRGVATTLGGNANGYYLDDLPFTGVTVPISPDVRSWDLERIEVLRGPQGTLFGEGSMGGTIRTLTNNARLNQFSFAGQTGLSHTTGGGNNRSVKAMVNIPIIDDKLAVRIATTDENYKGWIDNPVANKSNVNSSDVKSERVKVLFKPIDQLTMNASYWHFKGNYPNGNDATDAGNASQGTVLDAGAEYTLKGFSGTYDFDAFNVFYSYADNDFHIPESGALGGGTALVGIGIGVKTHELRVSSNAQKPWRWTAGVYRRTAARSDDIAIAVFDLNQTSDTDSKATSVFGEVTYTFPSFPLEASLGLRHFKDEIRGADVNNGVPSPVTNNTFSSNNPRFSLAYRPNENQQIYTSASKGFRSGQNQVTGTEALAAQYGLVLPASIKPDSIWTYELGTKVSALNRRLNMEFAIYHSDWKDFAIRYPIANTGLNALINSSGTRTNGADASFAYAVNRDFTTTLAVGLIDAKYKDAVTGTSIVAGTHVDDVPRTTISARADYAFALPDAWAGTARAGITHTSAHTAATFALDQAGDAIDNISARISASKGNWTVSLYGDNLKNDNGATSSRTGTQLSATEVELTSPRLRPRTIGLELRYAMGK